MKLAKKASAVFDSIIGVLAFAGGVFIVLLMLYVVADIVARDFLHSPLERVTQWSEHAMLFITFLGTAYVLKREEHVNVDLVLRSLNPKSRGVLTLVVSLLSAILCLGLTWYGAKVTWECFVEGVVFPQRLVIPQAPILAIIPVGFFLLCIQFLRRSYGCLRSIAKQEQRS